MQALSYCDAHTGLGALLHSLFEVHGDDGSMAGESPLPKPWRVQLTGVGAAAHDRTPMAMPITRKQNAALMALSRIEIQPFHF